MPKNAVVFAWVLLGVRRGKSVTLNATWLLIMWWLLGCLLHVAMFFEGWVGF